MMFFKVGITNAIKHVRKDNNPHPWEKDKTVQGISRSLSWSRGSDAIKKYIKKKFSMEDEVKEDNVADVIGYSKVVMEPLDSS